MRTFVIFATVAAAMAACPNGCSKNGVCGANDKCSCFQNWQGPDCSLRTCPFSLAWADTADGTNQAHYYAECSNKGVCDRKTGECKCFDGYEGKGCRRSTCPESCSGHGTCEYIDELASDYYDRRAGPGANKVGTSGTSQAGAASSSAVPVSNTIASVDNTRVYNGFLYNLWDAQKIQGCKCDLGYSGPDCASRIAPKGDDPLTTVKSTHTIQAISITAGEAISAQQFYIVYHDQYGGVWRTDTISASATDATTATRVKDALQRLPNEVLSGVDVTARTTAVQACFRFQDGKQHLASGDNTENACESTASFGAATTNSVDIDVKFADKAGQTGVQFILEVGLAARTNAGYFPHSAGFTHASASVTVAEVLANGNTDLGTISELAECADRGLDNGDGECECFDGFRGLACEEQEALV
jgi:hypothetical protein